MEAVEPSLVSSECACAVCGSDLSSNSINDTDTPPLRSPESKSGSSKDSVTSILFKCLCDPGAEDIENCEEGTLLHFCTACKDGLVEWRKLRTKICKLTEDANRIKLTLVAKLLAHYSNIRSRGSLVTASSVYSKKFSKLNDLVRRYANQFLPNVIVENTDFLEAATSIQAEQTHTGNDYDDAVNDFYPNGLQDCSDDGPRTGQGRSRKPRQRCNEKFSWVPLGRDCWLYADKYQVSYNFDERKFHCEECGKELDDKGSLLRHIRVVHMMIKKLKPPRGATGMGVYMCRRIGPNEFLVAEKYKFSVENESSFRCMECLHDTHSKNRILKHIREAHIYNSQSDEQTSGQSTRLKLLKGAAKQKKQPPASSTTQVTPSKPSIPSLTTQVAPNEFLYNSKYPIRYDPVEQIYSCGLCNMSYAQMRAVFPHIRGNHYTEEDRNQFRAVQVGDSEYLYGGKYPIKYRDGRYHCGLCNVSALEMSDLYAHIRVRHGSDKSTSKTLQTHGAVRKPDAKPAAVRTSFRSWGIPYVLDPTTRTYICSVCTQSTAHRTSMVVHIRNFHIEKPGQYVCERCGKSFQNQRYLTKHRDKHGDPKYKCDYCGKLFRWIKSYKLHVAVHEKGDEAKTFVCEYCGKRFTRNQFLLNHVRTHTGEKPFSCSQCGEKFADSAKVFYHRKTFHGHVPKTNSLD